MHSKAKAGELEERFLSPLCHHVLLSSVSLLRMKDLKRLMGSFIKEGKIKFFCFEEQTLSGGCIHTELGWLCGIRGNGWLPRDLWGDLQDLFLKQTDPFYLESRTSARRKRVEQRNASINHPWSSGLGGGTSSQSHVPTVLGTALPAWSRPGCSCSPQTLL